MTDISKYAERFPYSVENPKKTGDTIWVDYSDPTKLVTTYVYDEGCALAYWDNPANLTEIEAYAVWQMYPRKEKRECPGTTVELFDALARNCTYRNLKWDRKKKEEAQRRAAKKRAQNAQLSMF